MNSFEWIDASSVDEASRLLAESTHDRPVIAKAGGMDVLDLMKEGILRPARVVNLRTIQGLDGIQTDASRSLHLGALVTLAQISSDPNVLKHYGALAAAASHAATPQVRNVATLGGNLLQRPRCWYFRHEHFSGEDVAEAVRQGENQYHGIFATEQTPLVHASTPATALVAYDARVQLSSVRGQHTVAISDFLLPPDPGRDRDAALQQGEILTQVTLPALADGTQSAYRKQTERDSYDWPLCDVAVVLRRGSDARVESIAIALGWVAPTPMRATEAEAILLGHRVDEEAARRAARAAVSKAKPLSRNAYKVDVLEAVIRRTILDAATR
ncbi:xanthine dehydrogenase YagS FAD-binding subunit [Povalibacter uvarum]|uniref:Xanthine dehydrogenase YagS FAD-binding subunit n=1 Tax=Povalibacter uvarum TaxID=732238 RepID=A0A841HJ76_9GAMM|nr:FAD binding domain-containing protein [Povalibacter uvarum]MBB6092856.1 xanthine dehydrogenase YagS FAD-binding subunit [Povalibacter uvarum]